MYVVDIWHVWYKDFGVYRIYSQTDLFKRIANHFPLHFFLCIFLVKSTYIDLVVDKIDSNSIGNRKIFDRYGLYLRSFYIVTYYHLCIFRTRYDILFREDLNAIYPILVKFRQFFYHRKWSVINHPYFMSLSSNKYNTFILTKTTRKNCIVNLHLLDCFEFKNVNFGANFELPKNKNFSQFLL